MSELKLPFAPDEAAHYRKTVRRDESGRPKQKRQTGKMSFNQVGLLGGSVGESKADIKKKARPNFTHLTLIILRKAKIFMFTKAAKWVMMRKKMKPI